MEAVIQGRIFKFGDNINSEISSLNWFTVPMFSKLEGRWNGNGEYNIDPFSNKIVEIIAKN